MPPTLYFSSKIPPNILPLLSPKSASLKPKKKIPLKMTETALKNKEKKRTEQRKLKNQIPLLEEMEMLGSRRKKYMQIIFVLPETHVQCLNVYPSTF